MGLFREINRKEFYLKNCIVIILSLVFVITAICYVIDMSDTYSFDKINKYIVDKFLINREGIFVSIASIFIGIYFTIFTLLLSVKKESKIIKMGLKTYRELLVFIKHAFVGSFFYLIYVIIYPLTSWLQHVGFFKFIFEVFLAELVLYMLLSAIRVGIAYFIIFKSDLEHLTNNIDKELLEKEHRDEVISQLKSFLDEVEAQKSIKKGEDENKKSILKNPKPKKF